MKNKNVQTLEFGKFVLVPFGWIYLRNRRRKRKSVDKENETNFCHLCSPFGNKIANYVMHAAHQ